MCPYITLWPSNLATKDWSRPQPSFRRWSRNASLFLNGGLPFLITVTLLFSCTNDSSQNTKKVYLLNTGLLHMMDDIFWHMGLKTRSQLTRLCDILITIIFVYSNYFDYFYRFELPWAFLTMNDKNVARKLQTQSIHWELPTILHLAMDDNLHQGNVSF